MTARLHLLLVLVLLALTGCQRNDEVLAVARRDFQKENPTLPIVESGVRFRAGDRVTVYIRYIRRPAAVFPSKAGISERELVYARKGGKFLCVTNHGDTFIRPVQ